MSFVSMYTRTMHIVAWELMRRLDVVQSSIVGLIAETELPAMSDREVVLEDMREAVLFVRFCFVTTNKCVRHYVCTDCWAR